MNKKMTYEEWRNTIQPPNIDLALVNELRELHGIDACAEVESALRKEYEVYINGGYDK